MQDFVDQHERDSCSFLLIFPKFMDSDRFNTVKKLSGKDWVVAFCKRQGPTLREPEHCSIGRAIGFSTAKVTLFFENLKTCYEGNRFPPERCLNVDESGISAVRVSVPEVVTAKGKRIVCKVTSGEKGQTVTAVSCMSASGSYVPSALIFPRKRMVPDLFSNAPTGTLALVTESGFMNSDLFPEWLQHFSRRVKPTKDDPVLLILDSHVPHCTLAAVVFCRANHIALQPTPPHASHKLQPLDVGFFGPLKVAYLQEVDNWLVTNPGKSVSQRHVTGLFRAACTRTATVEKAENAFAATGICPYKPNIISDEDFEPSETIRRDEMPDENLKEIEDEHSNVDSPHHLHTPASPRNPDNVPPEKNYSY
jgi:hypothetical protein